MLWLSVALGELIAYHHKMDLTLFQNKVARLQEVVLNGFEDPIYVDNYEGVFRSHFDWHSSVHAHWMLLSSSRIFKSPEITTGILNRLNTQNLDSERKFLTDHPNFELPYGQAWLLLLFSEMNKHLAPNQQLKEFQHETYLRVADWLTRTDFPEKSKNAYHSWLFTYFLLINSDLFFSEPLIKLLKEKFHSVSMVKDENDPKDFFSSESLFAILNNQSKPQFLWFGIWLNVD